jgi:hypothetical protein
MANEITKLDGDGGLNANLLFIYSLTPITYNDAAAQPVTVIPTPSSGLPDMAGNILTAAEKAALDDGSSAFEIMTLDVPDAKTNAELLADARALYAEKKADFITRLNRAYNRAGQRFDEV